MTNSTLQALGLINYFHFAQQMKNLMKAADVEENRLREELDKKLAVLNRQRKFLSRRRTQLMYEVDTVRVRTERARQEAQQWTEEDREIWEESKVEWVEDTFWLREADVAVLERLSKEWATAKDSAERWNLEHQADRALELAELPSKFSLT